MLNDLAIAYKEAGRMTEALHVYGKILAADPSCVSAHVGVAWIAHESGKHELSREHFAAAIASLRASLERKENVSRCRLELATALRAYGELEQASALFGAILAEDSANTAAHAGLGWIAHERGDDPEALRHFRNAADLQPAQVGAQLTLARQLVRMNRLVEAERTCQGLPPDRSDVQKGLADISRQAGKLDEAAEHLAMACRLERGNTRLALELARLHVELGDLERAERVYRSVLEQGNADGDALYGLGEIAEISGDTSGALSWYRKADAAAPLDMRAQTRIRKLQQLHAPYDWRHEIEQALRIAGATDATLSSQLKAATILVEYGLVQPATPLLMRLQASSKNARTLLLAARQLERLGLGQSLSQLCKGATASPDNLMALTERPVPGSDTLLIVFGGTNNRLWITFSLLHRILQPAGISVIYVRDLRRDWYSHGVEGLGADVPSSAEGFKALAVRYGATRILTLGNCVGCTAAIRFGVALGARGVLGLGPKMGPRRISEAADQARLQSVRASPPAQHRNIRETYLNAERPPRVTLIYGELCTREVMALQVVADLPAFSLLPLRGSDDSDTVKDLLIRGLLGPVLHDFIASGSLSQTLQHNLAASTNAGSRC